MLRGLMSRVFTPRRMAAIEDQIRQVLRAVPGPARRSGGFDIIAELASMMPMRVVGMLLGIPGVRTDLGSRRQRRQLAHQAGRTAQCRRRRLHCRRPDLRRLRRMAVQKPSDDLMTTLLNVEFDDEQGVHRTLTRKEVLHYTQVVAGAGNETTVG